MKLTKPLLITKLKATGVHLLLSILVFIYLVYRIYYDWYPQPFFAIDGGWQGIRIVAAVDLVLGPVITFLIFDLSKSRREILFDLTTIVVIQFAALAYGVYATYSQRPVVVTLIGQYMITGTMEQVGGKLKSASDFYQYSDERPPIIFADIRINEKTLEEIGNLNLWDSIIDYMQDQVKNPKSEFAAGLRERQSIFTDSLDAYKAREVYESWLQQNGKSEGDVMISRIAGRYGESWLVFDLDGKYLSYFP